MVSYKIRERSGAKGTSFMLDMMIDGQRYRPTFKTKSEAESHAKQKLNKLAKESAADTLGIVLSNQIGARPKIKLADAIRKHTEVKAAEIKTPENIRAFKYIQKYIYDGLFDLGVDYVHEITLEKVQLLRSSWSKKGHANTTINKRIGALKSLLNQCLGWEYIEKNPCQHLKPLSDDTKPRVPWTFDVFLAIQKNVPEWCGDFLEFLYSFGARPVEGINMKDEDIDFKKQLLILRTNKGGGSSRVLPMTDRQTEFLKQVMAKRDENYPGAEYVFVDDRGGRIYRNRVSDHVAAARKVLKLKQEYVPYGNRHSLITDLLDMDVSFSKVQLLAGHKRADTTKRYTHLSDASLRNVMNLAEERRRRQA